MLHNMTDQEAIEFLINNPDKSIGSLYHDAGSCWRLIDLLITYVKILRAQIKEGK